MIKLYPEFGLCNRMRAIDSALSLASQTDRGLQVFWERNNDLNSRFSDLFKPIRGMKIIECERRPFIFKYGSNKNLFTPSFLRVLLGGKFFDSLKTKELGDSKHQFEDLSKYKILWFTGFTRFFENKAMYRLFEPIPKIQVKIDEETKDFDEHTIGVHIRRTDNVKAIENSPLHLFKEVMQAELQKQPLTKFYLASDDLDVKLELSEVFKDKLITNFEVVRRDSQSGMERAVIELFSLSRTQKVYGSLWSSFSHTACDIGGIPEITVKI